MPTHKKGGHGRGSEAPAARTMGERTYRCHPVDRTHLRRGPPTPWRPLGVSLAKAQLRHKSQNSDRPNRECVNNAPVTAETTFRSAGSRSRLSWKTTRARPHGPSRGCARALRVSRDLEPAHPRA